MNDPGLYVYSEKACLKRRVALWGTSSVYKLRQTKLMFYDRNRATPTMARIISPVCNTKMSTAVRTSTDAVT